MPSIKNISNDIVEEPFDRFNNFHNFYLLVVNYDLTIRFVNNTLLNLLQFEKPEIVNEPVQVILSTSYKMIIQDALTSPLYDKETEIKLKNKKGQLIDFFVFLKIMLCTDDREGLDYF
ncbi:MAG: hypothetical protein PVH88_26030 [Ignavibacteria bacterium]|jgi:hypothetical protein